MGHNSVVSGHPKSIGIPQVDGLSMGPSGLGCHSFCPKGLFGKIMGYGNSALF